MPRRAVWGLLLAGAALVLAWVLLRLAFPWPYRSLVEAEAARHGLDPVLVAALVHVESRFNPRAVSSRGARGLMQVMPETGSWVAQRLGWGALDPDHLFIPEVNLRIGTWYLAELRRLFRGDTVLALAAYNAGASHVKTWVEENPGLAAPGPAWAKVSAIPFPETRTFVRRVMITYALYRWLYEPWRSAR